MSGRATRRRGMLITIRETTHRRWVGFLLLLAVCTSPWVVAEATITTTGQVTAVVGPGNTTVTSLGVGTNGTGTLTVNGGNVLTTNGLVLGGVAPNPLDSSTWTFGHGTVLVDGVGSRVEVTNHGAVTVGRIGGTSLGELYVTNGGALTSSVLNVGIGNITSDRTAGSTGIMSVGGAGTSVTLSGTFTNGAGSGGTIGSDDGGSGGFTLENSATMSMTAVGATTRASGFTVGFNGGTGAFNILSGASLTMDGAGATGGTPGFTIGNNATGSLTVSGGSLTINANQFGGGITVGTGGGEGTTTFDNGSTVVFNPSALSMIAGHGFTVGGTAGSHGTLTVQGGTTLNFNSSSTSSGVTIGNLGIGTMTVSGVGTTVNQTGLNSSATPGNTIANQAGSDGTLTIQDGAVWTLNRSSAGCCMTVGRLGHGVLRILSGGQMILNDSSSTGGGGIAFGGNSTSSPGGHFDALISGPGSTLSIYGIDANFTLGRATGGSGTMTVDNGATVNADTFSVGFIAGASATMNVSGSGTGISLVGDPDGIRGAGFTVGAGGTGTMTVSAGAVITIDSTGTPQPSGFSVGGSRTSLAGGTGTLTIDGGGTLIQILGTQKGFNVGFDNTCLSNGPCNMPSTGTLTVSNGAQILTGADHRSSIGSTPGSTGTTVVTGGGSLIDAGAFLGIGKDRDGNPGGTGTLTVSMGGTVKATVINCGAGGTINGDGGTLIGDVIADPGCTIAPGASPGTLSIVGTFTGAGAKIVLEVDQFGNHDVLAVQGTTVFEPSTQIEVRIDPAYQPDGSAVLELVQVQATPTDPVQTLLTLTVVESGGGTVTASGDLNTLSEPIAVVPDITIDPTVRAVAIDIKPGEFPNVINLGSAGTIPVAIISTVAFDALTVDPATIALHSLSTPGVPNVKLAGNGDRLLCSAKDVNGDGRPDLVCHVVTSTLPLVGESIAVLDAVSYPGGPAAGIPIRGADFIKIVP